MKSIVNKCLVTAGVMLGALMLAQSANAAHWVKKEVIHEGHGERVIIKKKCHGRRHGHHKCKIIVKEKYRHHRWW